MLKELHTYEEIGEYLNELNNFSRARLYGMAYSYSKIIEKENLIRETYKDDKFYRIEEIFLINDDYQIVKVIRKANNKILYDIFVDFKSIHQMAEDFDSALISAISYKYTRSTTASMYFAKMIDMQFR